MNRAEKIFWLILMFILSAIVIGFIFPIIGLWMIIVLLNGIIISATMVILWFIYIELED